MIPVEISYFNWVDIAIIFLMLIFVFFGYFRGFIKEVFGLISWGLAFILSWFSCNYVGGLFKDLIKIQDIRIGLGFILVFVVSLTLFLLTTALISEKVNEGKLRAANKAIGGVFGFIKAFVVVLAICMVTIIFASKGNFDKALDKSKFGPHMKEYAIESCAALKKYLKSEQFKQLSSYLAHGDIVNDFVKKDPSKDVKKLAEPKISEAVFLKHAEEAYNARREKFLRQQAAIGPENEEVEPKEVPAVKDEKNDKNVDEKSLKEIEQVGKVAAKNNEKTKKLLEVLKKGPNNANKSKKSNQKVASKSKDSKK